MTADLDTIRMALEFLWETSDRTQMWNEAHDDALAALGRVAATLTAHEKVAAEAQEIVDESPSGYHSLRSSLAGLAAVRATEKPE